MKTLAQIQNGIIVNIQIINDTDSLPSDSKSTWIDVSSVNPKPGIGWSYNNTAFVVPAAPTPQPSFLDVTPRQFRQALALSNIDSATIDAAINALPSPQNTMMKIEWEYSTAFQRYRPTTIALAKSLGYTDAQLDALWILAASLN